MVMKKIFYYFIIFSSLSLIIAYLPIGKCSSITTEDAYLDNSQDTLPQISTDNSTPNEESNSSSKESLLLSDKLFSKITTASSMSFYVTDGFDYNSQIIETDYEQTKKILLELDKITPQTDNIEHHNSNNPKYYLLLLVDGNNYRRIDIYEDYLCISNTFYYKNDNTELLECITQIFIETDNLKKYSPSEALSLLTNETSYELFFENNNYLCYTISEGFGTPKHSEQGHGYKTMLLCSKNMYFNEDCGVSYEIANKTVYYNDDGTIFDSYTHHMGYFNILNGTCTFYSTSTSVENQIIF